MSRYDCQPEIEKRLTAVLAYPDGSHVADYTDALIGAAQVHGPEVLSQEEWHLAGAMACDTCIQSSGLASCFQYAAPHLLCAEKAMTMIRLPFHADLLRRAIMSSGVSDDATTSSLNAVFASKLGDDFSEWMLRLEPLEDAYLNFGLRAVTDAVLAYIQQHHGALSRFTV